MTAPPDDLLAAVLAAPDDDAPRRALAAFWTAAGDPRGSWIEVQLALAATPTWHPSVPQLRERERQLLASHGEALRAGLPVGRLEVRFGRGLATYATGSPRALADDLPRLAAVAPITAIGVEFDDDGVGDEELTRLLDCPPLGRVRSLSAPEGDCAPASWRRLCEAPALSQLRELWLGPGLTSTAVIEAMAAGQVPPQLQVLVLEGFTDGIGDAGAVRLAAAPWCRRLRELALRGQALGDGAIEALAREPLALRRLDLANVGYRDNHASAAAIEALAAVPWFARLETLNLVGCAIGAAAALAIGCAAQLQRAYLSRTGLVAADMPRLLAAPCWSNLRELSLAGNELGDAAMPVLAAAKTLPNVLDLSRCGIAAAGLDALADAPAVDALDLRANALSAEDWQRALAAGRTPRATALMLDGHGFSADLCDGLRQRFLRCDLIGAPPSA